ncbi:hypothetical protein GP486_000153 [Trichoglossum hirsutum]|uniref:Uncharacterized protein n=1 Tax=Trichoglossum hirsutum TaxID=265104 RepID=A0A9P8LJA1_9PEZI|nr:hypothetical protein GP486_000153 [Trichoglossum hirsutum]
MKPLDRVQKKWVVQQLRRAASQKSMEGMQKYQEAIMEVLLSEGSKTKLKSLAAGDATVAQIEEIFGLKFSDEVWELCEETYDVPPPLVYNLDQLKKAFYDTCSEAYNRIAIDYLMVACKVKHNAILSKQLEASTGDSAPQVPATTPKPDQTSEIAGSSSDIRPTTPSEANFGLPSPLPIRVFPEMALSVRVAKGGQEWLVSGIADWALGYGERSVLEDGTVMIAVEAKRTENIGHAKAQLLAYLATIRQLRIQANKTNVMTQGFYSDGQEYTFVCIRNDGSVMFSMTYNLLHRGKLKTVYNFLLSMLDTAAKSSPHTSPTKRGPAQNEEIQNFDRDIFVKVFKDGDGAGSITPPIIYHDETDEEEWPDFSLIPEEEI